MAETEHIHAVNANRFMRGDVFGWQDDRSETGFLSGIVVSTGPCVVEVRDIRAAVIQRRVSPGRTEGEGTDNG